MTAEVITLVFIWLGAVTGLYIQNPVDEACRRVRSKRHTQRHQSLPVLFDVESIISETLNLKKMPFDAAGKRLAALFF